MFLLYLSWRAESSCQEPGLAQERAGAHCLDWMRWEKEVEGSLEAPVCSEQTNVCVARFSPVPNTVIAVSTPPV